MEHNALSRAYLVLISLRKYIIRRGEQQSINAHCLEALCWAYSLRLLQTHWVHRPSTYVSSSHRKYEKRDFFNVALLFLFLRFDPATFCNAWKETQAMRVSVPDKKDRGYPYIVPILFTTKDQFKLWFSELFMLKVLNKNSCKLWTFLNHYKCKICPKSRQTQ